jgi:predicted Zn-ribbon and HTH transcriptional regulator
MKRIDRHSYPVLIVQLVVELYLLSGCGFQKVSDLLSYLNNFFKLGLNKIPCANSIENWVKKSGYTIYHQAPKAFSEKEYATIVDESMMLGSEKMILTLGVEAEKIDNNALKHDDVKVLNMAVAEKWNSDTIGKNMEETEKKVGHSPLYAISDNDSKLRKTFQGKAYSWIRDIGHTVAILIEQVYGKDEVFKKFTKKLSAVKSREVMRPSSYLLPPRQRTIARFMNLSPVINWSMKIYQNFLKLSMEERKNFKFVKNNFPLVEELGQIFSCVNNILKQAKNKGFSKEKIESYVQEIKDCLTHQGTRVQHVKSALCAYLEEEKEKIPNAKNCWHCSSDIIESLFGAYKYRRARNPLNGITSYVLVVPLMSAVGHKPEPSKIDFKGNLESVYMKDLTQWKEDNLTENLAVKRRKKLVA